MKDNKKQGSKKGILTALGVALISVPLMTAPAHAGAVVNWTGTDGFSAEPYVQGTNIFHIRLDSSFPGFSTGNALMPGLNLSSAITDGLDLGIGGGLNFSSIGTSLSNISMGAIYPWIRAAIPVGIENLKAGVMVGTSIPVNTNNVAPNINNMNNRLSTEFFPGITGLMDVYLGQFTGADFPLTMGVNAGYARGLTSGTNLMAGNLNFTLPYSNLIFYEEQFVNYPVGGYANGGVRFGINVPVSNKVMFDIKPAALWDVSSAGISWTFNPSVGASVRF